MESVMSGMVSRETFTLTPYQPEHYVKLWDAMYLWQGIPDQPDKAQMAESYAKGPAMSAVEDSGEVLACAGVLIPWSGLGYAWCVISGRGKERYPLALHYAVKRILRGIMKTRGLRRVQATVFDGAPRNERWMIALGFHKESEMPKWGPRGETGHVYVRLA